MAIFSVVVLITRVAILLFCIPPMAISNYISFQKLPLPTGVTGPASFAFNSLGGGPYVGVQDGRILKYEAASAAFLDFAFLTPTRSKEVCDGHTNDDLGPSCGRPLSLDFNPLTHQLYVADAYFGLLVVSINGGLGTQLVSGVNGVPFRFLNGVALDPLTGDVYITEFSAVYGLRNASEALNGDATGSLLKYDPKTKQVSVLATGLSRAAGVAVSGDGTFVLVAELVGKRIQRFWIKGPKKNTAETFISFQGRPNKIRRTGVGDFWVAENELIRPPAEDTVPTRIKINPFGIVLEKVALDKEYNNTRITEVQEHNRAYYIGSRSANFVGVYDYDII